MFSFGLGALTSSRRISAPRFNSSPTHEQVSQADFSLMFLLSGLTVTVVCLICDLRQRFTVGAPGARCRGTLTFQSCFMDLFSGGTCAHLCGQACFKWTKCVEISRESMRKLEKHTSWCCFKHLAGTGSFKVGAHGRSRGQLALIGIETAPPAAWWQLAHLYCPRIFYSVLRLCSFGPGGTVSCAGFGFSRRRPEIGEKNSGSGR